MMLDMITSSESDSLAIVSWTSVRLENWSAYKQEKHPATPSRDPREDEPRNRGHEPGGTAGLLEGTRYIEGQFASAPGQETRPASRSPTFFEQGVKLSSTFHFPEMMLNLNTRFGASRLRCSVSDSLVRRTADAPEYKLVSCLIRKARKGHLRNAGEVSVNACSVWAFRLAKPRRRAIRCKSSPKTAPGFPLLSLTRNAHNRVNFTTLNTRPTR